MKNAKEFLGLCRHRFPSPRPAQRHTLTLEGDTMVLTLLLGETWQSFNLSEEDLAKSAVELLADLVEMMKTPPEPPAEPITAA